MEDSAVERWGDESDSDDELVPEEVDIDGPNTGHVYMHPFMLGNLTIRTHGDFIFHMQDLYCLFIDYFPGKHGDVVWADLVQGLTDTGDTDAMDSTSLEFIIMSSDFDIDETAFDALRLADFAADDTAFNISDEAKNALAKAVEDLSLDVFDKEMEETKFEVHPMAYMSAKNVRPGSSATCPPLAPVAPDSKPQYLRICAERTGISNLFEERTSWQDILVQNDKNFPIESIDDYKDDVTIQSSRSNTRPLKDSSVMIVYENGDEINVGSHGYSIKEDYDYEIDFKFADYALDEFFSAPGGEGLTTATPSHLLHQMVSAVLSNSFKNGMTYVEKDSVDIQIAGNMFEKIDILNVDITTSAGIWNKKLSPDKSNPHFRYQAAVSKYDMSAIIASCSTDDVKDAFLKASANCLAHEYPGFFRVDEVDVPTDLKLQAAIYDTISAMPNARIKELGELAYEAAVDECLDDITQVDIKYQGMPWREKKDILLSSVQNLKTRSNIAIPPLPIGEIKPFDKDSFSIMINGHNFCSGPFITQGRTAGPKYVMDNPKNFLAHYPAIGIVSEKDAREIARILDITPLSVTGYSHSGPGEGFSGKDSVYMDAAGEIFKSSSSAQLAEIRSDLVRTVQKNPMPRKGIWVQSYLYKGKVSCWYRCRDAPNSANGYRIDWFAVSKFEVIGSNEIKTDQGDTVYLWPRQRIRSQEMKLAHMGPRRLKLTLYSMLEKTVSSRSDHLEISLAWERLAITLNSSTYSSGKNFLTCRYLSSTLGSPSSPFHEMGKKLVQPKTFADIFYIERLSAVLGCWTARDQYRSRSPLLGLPRAFSQLESYWTMWVPCDFADSTKNMAECIIGLSDEAYLINRTMVMRSEDLSAQLSLLTDNVITLATMRSCLRTSCSMDTAGKLGWSWIGSLASGYALNSRSDAGAFDRNYGRGKTSRTLIDHLTVRHSARIDKNKQLQKGTVAEMMLDSGCDNFLSCIDQTYRFLFLSRPVFFNHPKGGEHKEREISITDPDSRIALSDAELICGKYGKTTKVDFLKDPGKNAKFYKASGRVLQKGGGIQSSDATRYGPNMSNMAIAIMLVFLGAYSTHLKWAGVVYARMAYRQMLLPTSTKSALEKMCAYDDTKEAATKSLRWMSKMPVRCYDAEDSFVWYTTSHHMGQGMSHHSSSLLHAGGIIVAVDAAHRVSIIVRGKLIKFSVGIMVTSDDSTLIVEANASDAFEFLNRAERQVASRIFLQIVRAARGIALRMVSVLANLVKEVISATKGEFNSQDTGIGETCPILGFRELNSLLVAPSAPSLIGDYLSAHACARDIAFAGQGLSTGNIAQRMMIDAIEERWGLNQTEKLLINNINIIPAQLHAGCDGFDLASSPCSWLNHENRASLYRMAVDKNLSSEDLDPHTRDSVFSPLMHVKVSMSRQHRNALARIKLHIAKLKSIHKPNQARMLEQSLRATMSSAKSRNLGTVAQKVRYRNVVPRDYGDTKFQKNTMIQHTLDWLTHVNKKVNSDSPAGADIEKGNQLSGYVKMVSRQRFGFPRAPRLKRFQPQILKKPKFLDKSYGKTPFARHALERSGTITVPSIGAAEREIMQEYVALVNHRKFSEHVEYGNAFVTSWATQECAVIVALDITGDIFAQQKENIKWGNFSPPSIELLKTLAETTCLPVLALHRHDGVRGQWHCIHKGQALTVIHAYDLDTIDGNAIQHTLDSGMLVILALQGIIDEHNWVDSVPMPDEVHRYQYGVYSDAMPNIVRSVENENMVDSAVINASYSTVVSVENVNTLVYITPNVSTTPEHNRSLIPFVPQLRGKVIAGLATGGYWHTTLRGTCFRAYLKDQFFEETLWTGGVLGWHNSSSSVPTYFVSDAHTVGVKAIILLDGFNDPDMLSGFNSDIFSPGYKVMSQSNTMTFECAIEVDVTFRDIIVAANFGRRFQVSEIVSTFMNCGHGPVPIQEDMMRQPEACECIVDRLRGQDQTAAW